MTQSIELAIAVLEQEGYTVVEPKEVSKFELEIGKWYANTVGDIFRVRDIKQWTGYTTVYCDGFPKGSEDNFDLGTKYASELKPASIDQITAHLSKLSSEKYKVGDIVKCLSFNRDETICFGDEIYSE